MACWQHWVVQIADSHRQGGNCVISHEQERDSAPDLRYSASGSVSTFASAKPPAHSDTHRLQQVQQHTQRWVSYPDGHGALAQERVV